MGSYIPPQKYPFPWKDLNTQQGSPVVLHISRFCDHNCRQTQLKVLAVNFVTAESFFSFLRTVTVEYSYKSAALTHTHKFNSPLSGTTRVSWYQTVKTNLDFTEARDSESGDGISWAVCKSAPRSRQITMPAPHHSVFYRLDALPAAQPTASKH